MLGSLLLICSQGRVGTEDECFAGRAGEHPEEFFGREAGLTAGGGRDDHAVEVFDVPESFERVDWRAAAFDAGVDRDACS
jgi:hypothetical protein